MAQARLQPRLAARSLGRGKGVEFGGVRTVAPPDRIGGIAPQVRLASRSVAAGQSIAPEQLERRAVVALQSAAEKADDHHSALEKLVAQVGARGRLHRSVMLVLHRALLPPQRGNRARKVFAQ